MTTLSLATSLTSPALSILSTPLFNTLSFEEQSILKHYSTSAASDISELSELKKLYEHILTKDTRFLSVFLKVEQEKYQQLPQEAQKKQKVNLREIFSNIFFRHEAPPLNHLPLLLTSPLWKEVIEVPNFINYTALYEGVRGRRQEAVRFLVAAGANLNYVPLNSVSILSQALIQSMDLDFIQYLLDQGANPNLGSNNPTQRDKDFYGKVSHPIHFVFQQEFTALSQQKSLAQLLYRYGANLNVPGSQGDTALIVFMQESPGPMSQASEIQLDIFSWLIQSGADYKHRNQTGQNIEDIMRLYFKAREYNSFMQVIQAIEENKKFNEQIPSVLTTLEPQKALLKPHKI